MTPLSRAFNIFDPWKVTAESLDGGCDLKTFSVKHSANFYVFTYEKDGTHKHTLIDSGDYIYRGRILGILRENDVLPENIERIVITHHHIDHCGLADALAGASGAEILVHGDFRNFVEGEITRDLRPWLGGFVPARLRKRKMKYLDPAGKEYLSIGGVDFPKLTGPLPVGDTGFLEILACPKSATTHSENQIIVTYSPMPRAKSPGEGTGGIRLTDRIIFSGDLWLMHGPVFEKSLRYFYRRTKAAWYRLLNRLSGKPTERWDPREQDTVVKEALKLGFPLIRVKPGHGEEFLGTRLIPNCLLADRDLLLALGYPIDGDKTILKKEGIAPKVRALLEKAYGDFAAELLFWMEQGYDAPEISDLLVRIYREQEGGGRLVEEDRKERRVRLKETLARLRDDKAAAEGIRNIAKMTLPRLSF